MNPSLSKSMGNIDIEPLILFEITCLEKELLPRFLSHMIVLELIDV